MVARAPNHLGDGVMALPAITALARLGRLEVRGPRWIGDLYGHLGVALAPPGRLDRRIDAEVLFPPSLRAALEARRARRRVGTPTDFRRWLLTDVVEEREHRAETYAALARAVGASPAGAPRLGVPKGPIPPVPPGHVGLNPCAGAGRVREWPGFGALADRLDAPLVFYGGPGEQARIAVVAGRHPIRVGLSLPDFARALSRCAVFVSNDSGAAHFARALGVPTVVVYGSSAPERTGPAGAASVRGPAPPCSPCYRARCRFDHECFDIDAERVRVEVVGLLGG